jgi:hypothetical protein
MVIGERRTSPRSSRAGSAERASTLVTLLTVDAALLAMMELFFLTLSVGAVPVPVSPLVALVSTPWLVHAAGQVGGPRAAAAPLLAWTFVVAVLGLAGPGGDVLLVADWSSLALVVCGLLPAAFVLGRVLRGGREAQARGPEPGTDQPDGGQDAAGDTGQREAAGQTGEVESAGQTGEGEALGEASKGDAASVGRRPESTRRHG